MASSKESRDTEEGCPLLCGVGSLDVAAPVHPLHNLQPQEACHERSQIQGSRILNAGTRQENLDGGGTTASPRSIYVMEDDGWVLQTIATEWSDEACDFQEAEIPHFNSRNQELDVESFISCPSVQRLSFSQRRLHNTPTEESSLEEHSFLSEAVSPLASVEDEGARGDYSTSSTRAHKPKKWLIRRLLNTVEDSSSAECSSPDEDDTLYDVSSLEDEVWDSSAAPASARKNSEEEENGQLAPDWWSSVHLGEGRATKKIGEIIESAEHASEVEARFPELLVGLVNTIFTGLQRTIDGAGNQENQDLPPEETAQIVRRLLERVAQVTPEDSCWESLCSPHFYMRGVSLLVSALLQEPSSTVPRLKDYLASVFSLQEDPEKHSLAEVAFFVELLHHYQHVTSREKIWTLLVAWLAHHNPNIRYWSEAGILHIYGNLKAVHKLQDFSAGILGGLRTSRVEAILGVLGFMEQLRHCHPEDMARVNGVLAALCLPLFHHEEAKIRRAAMKTSLGLRQHRYHHEGREQTIATLIAVLMHVEDEEPEVAQAAKDNLALLAEALQWHLEGRLLARETYSLQELLHKISKRLIRQLGSVDAVESEAHKTLDFFRSQQASVRRTAAMLIGHLAYKKGSILTEANVNTYHAGLGILLGDQDPEVRRVACKTENILRKAFSLHSRQGLRAAVRRLWAGWSRKRYPPEYEDLSA